MKKQALLILLATLPLFVVTDSAAADSNKPTTTAMLSNKEGMKVIATEESDSFARQITANIPNQNRKQILENYINSLLKANAIYSLGNSNKEPRLIYQVHASREGVIIATRSEQDKYGVQIGNKGLPVYGINYELESDCSWQEQLCWVFYPSPSQQKERWLEISYAPHAIGELMEGVSLLIRSLQK
ncbi:hypothetical protein [Endozoicomonas elysicola]|uniref:Uncharacterized protein n=1 Tax=Endozoicomonas elysicola TaxID=305900 RepID=A0A081K7C1_9GAMM|nr:hypothetical protein [Endozoicomonas elysicola]KEI70047.1 hypothetical protein GV64_04170 [Endozoicomonas elysicola]